MRVIALLCWYEEDPAWLAETVASTSKLCDHIVAVDGAYAAFPGALRKPSSGSEQADVIAHTAAGVGMGSTIHVPRQPWWDGEVGKRDFHFRLATTIADPDDWYLIIDGDEVLSDVASDTREQLSATDSLVAELTHWEREANQDVAALVDTSADYSAPERRLFRALPDLGVSQAHYVYSGTHEGRRVVLRGNTTVHHIETPLTLPDVRMEHRTRRRSVARQRQKATYYSQLPSLERVEAFT